MKQRETEDVCWRKITENVDMCVDVGEILHSPTSWEHSYHPLKRLSHSYEKWLFGVPGKPMF